MNVSPDNSPVRRTHPHVVVVFAGESGSGKTTVRDAVMRILEKDGHLYPVKESFARPVKAEARDRKYVPGTPSFRSACQKIGDQRRNEDPDYYVERMRWRVNAHPFPCVFLIDDCRYRNETQIADLVFRLHTMRPNGLTAEQRLHPSENEWREIHATETFTTDFDTDAPRIARIVADKVIAFAEASNKEAA